MTSKELDKKLTEEKNAIWADIERLSELKSNYNCFDEKEEPYYSALSDAIYALRDKAEEMNNDLISREALKKALKNRNECENCTDIDCINCFYDLIDNAPAETPQNEWVPVSERMPEGRIDPVTNDFEYVLCSTTLNDVRSYKFGKRIGEDKAHFWYGGVIMDEYITAWQPLPKPYQKGDAV